MGLNMENYDDVYRKPGFYWGKIPNDFCLEVLDHITRRHLEGATLLDLGSGEGRDLICFASRGLDVTGVDVSKAGLEKAQSWAEEQGLAIKTKIGDLNGFRLDEMFDIVYSSGTLTYIREDNRKEVFDNIKEHTNQGGLNAFNDFVFNPDLRTPPDWGKDEHFFMPGELSSFYRGWEIIKFSENIFDCSSGGVPHRHDMETVIARKI